MANEMRFALATLLRAVVHLQIAKRVQYARAIGLSEYNASPRCNTFLNTIATSRPLRAQGISLSLSLSSSRMLNGMRSARAPTRSCNTQTKMLFDWMIG